MDKETRAKFFDAWMKARVEGLAAGGTWNVPEGACGFAWVSIKPATRPFARWLKQQGYAKSAYGGGLQIWISEFNQSVERKYAMATAMAKALNGVDGIRAYADSRLD